MSVNLMGVARLRETDATHISELDFIPVPLYERLWGCFVGDECRYFLGDACAGFFEFAIKKDAINPHPDFLRREGLLCEPCPEADLSGWGVFAKLLTPRETEEVFEECEDLSEIHLREPDYVSRRPYMRLTGANMWVESTPKRFSCLVPLQEGWLEFAVSPTIIVPRYVTMFTAN